MDVWVEVCSPHSTSREGVVIFEYPELSFLQVQSIFFGIIRVQDGRTSSVMNAGLRVGLFLVRTSS